MKQKEHMHSIPWMAACLAMLSVSMVSIGIPASAADTSHVYGYVREESGDPIPGATVQFISGAADTTDAVTDESGWYEVTLPAITGVDDARPDGFALRQNYPNPFNPTTTIEYDIPSPSHVILDIYSITGQRIRRLVDDSMDAGRHMVRWNGRDERERSLGAGIYFYHLRADGYTATRKMLLLDGGGVSVSNVPVYRKAATETAYQFVVEREGYRPHREESVVINAGTTEKNVVLVHTKFLLYFESDHFYNMFYTPDDTITVVMVEESDTLPVIDTNLFPLKETTVLPREGTVTVTTDIGDVEELELQDGGSFYIKRYFENCREIAYCRYLRNSIPSMPATIAVPGNGIIETSPSLDSIRVDYTTVLGDRNGSVISIEQVRSEFVDGNMLELWNGTWYNPLGVKISGDHIIAKYKAGVTQEDIDDCHKRYGLEVEKFYPLGGTYTLLLSPGDNPVDIILQYKQEQVVLWASLDGTECMIMTHL